MNKNIYLKNSIDSKYFKKKLYKKNKIKLTKIINNISSTLDLKKDVFHSLSKKFNLNFKRCELLKFNKYK